jgi:hypothetical protein
VTVTSPDTLRDDGVLPGFRYRLPELFASIRRR